MPIVPLNAMVKTPKNLATFPFRPGADVFLRDLARIEILPTFPRIRPVNGTRVYILVIQAGDARPSVA